MGQRSVPECFLIHYSATTKIRNMKMINNTKSFRLPLFLFMTNLPTMSGDHEHKKTTDHNWIPVRHNLWHKTHLSIKKYQNMAKLEPTSSHRLHKQHTNFLRNRTWSFTHSLLYFMFNHEEISDHDWMSTRQSPWHSTHPNRFGQSNQHPQSTINQHYLDTSLMSCKRRNEDTATVHKKTMINSILKFSLYKCIMHLDRMLCMLDSKKKINNRLVVANKDRIKDKVSTLSSINRLSIHCNWKSDHSTSCGNQSIPPRVENKLSTLCGQNLSFHYKWELEHSASGGKQAVHLVWTKTLFPNLCGNYFLYH